MCYTLPLITSLTCIVCHGHLVESYRAARVGACTAGVAGPTAAAATAAANCDNSFHVVSPRSILHGRHMDCAYTL